MKPETAKTDQPLVSIVILCWNRKDDIEKSLREIRKDDYPEKEVIVVDNASTDGGPEMIEKEFPEVRLIRFPENTGIYAYNVGFETARGKYILILDDDSYPLEGCIRRSVEELEKNKDVGCITAKIVNPGGTSQWPEDNIESVHDTFCFIGCGAMVPKGLFREVGYYPSDYFLFHNELATSLRIINKGYAIRYYPDIACFHKSAPSHRMNDKRMYYLIRNGSWNIWQFAPLKHLAYYYPGFILRNLWLAFKYNAFGGFVKGILSSYGKAVKYGFRKREPCNAAVYTGRLSKRIRRKAG